MILMQFVPRELCFCNLLCEVRMVHMLVLLLLMPMHSAVHNRVALKHNNVSAQDSERLMTMLSSTPQVRRRIFAPLKYVTL